MPLRERLDTRGAAGGAVPFLTYVPVVLLMNTLVICCFIGFNVEGTSVGFQFLTELQTKEADVGRSSILPALLYSKKLTTETVAQTCRCQINPILSTKAL